jgi:hypothetical protein
VRRQAQSLRQGRGKRHLVRGEFAASGCYTAHIKVDPRRSRRSDDEDLQEKEGAGEKTHPTRRWVVERTISWLAKRRGLRTRWSKKSENWLALIQPTCAHVLLNLAVFG